jgi:hypothetical protein
MNWKVYRTYLEKWQPFIFYLHDKKFTPISDINNPVPPTNCFWIKENNTYPKVGPFIPDRIAVPVVRMKTEHINDYFIVNFPGYHQKCSDVAKELDYSMHIIVKHWGDGTSEVGLCAWYGITDLLDKELQNYVDRYMKLLVFS